MPSNLIRNLTVDEYTTPKPISVALEASFAEIMTTLKTHKIRHLPVVESDTVVGVISERDVALAKQIEHLARLDDLIAKDVMTPNPYVVEPNTLLADVAFEMSKRKIGSAIVVDPNDHSVGIFTSTDALNALIEVLRDKVEPAFNEPNEKS